MSTSTQTKNKWNTQHYRRIIISLPIAEAERYENICKKKLVSLSCIPKKAIIKYINEYEDLK